MKTLISIALPVAAALGVCAPAYATAFTVTLSGTIATGADDRGIFGPAHTPLTGDAFTIRYTVNPVSMTTTTDTDGVSPLYRFDTPGQMTISITINDHTFSFVGTAQAMYSKSDHAAADGNPAFSVVRFNAYDGTNSLSESATADNAPLGGQAPLSGTLEHSTLDLSLFGGQVRASSVATGTITVGAVPEPASWAMMLAGFGLVGGAMRQRKTRIAFAR
jgi:hypothetical protein